MVAAECKAWMGLWEARMHLLVKGPRLLLVGVLDHAQPVAQLLIRVARWRAHFAGGTAADIPT